MAQKLEDLERQIADLAARVDPSAFRYGADPAFEERRRAASHAAGEMMYRSHAYVGASAALMLGLAMTAWFIAP